MNDLITLHIQQTADLLTTYRVSQDGWAKVLERTVTDLHDLAAALQTGKEIGDTQPVAVHPAHGQFFHRHPPVHGLEHRLHFLDKRLSG